MSCRLVAIAYHMAYHVVGGVVMVVVRDAETLMRMVGLGYKPYYHRAVRRWYLRRSSERHIIARELEPLAKRIAEELEMGKSLGEGRRRELFEEAVRLRAKGLPLREVVERTGIPKTTFYRRLDEIESVATPRKLEIPNHMYGAIPSVPPRAQPTSQVE